jgi:PHD/YefM family antitoxin component YafN of YafNO toxin-antitoxin module
VFNEYLRPARELGSVYPGITDIVRGYDHVVFTSGGKGEAVLVGMDEYREFEEFLHERYVEAKLAEARSEADDPSTVRTEAGVVLDSIRLKYGL